MSEMVEEQNKALVLAAFDTLFNKRDYARRSFGRRTTSSTAPIFHPDERDFSTWLKIHRRH